MSNHEEISEEQATLLREELGKMFAQADTDQNQKLDLVEFEELMRRLMPETTHKQCGQIFDTLDKEKSGSIPYKSLLQDKEQFYEDTKVDTRKTIEEKVEATPKQLNSRLTSLTPDTHVLSSLTAVSDDNSRLGLAESDQKAQIATQVLNDMEQLKQRLYKLFEEGDKDHNDLIDALEFSEVMLKVMPNAQEADITNLFNAFDVDKSGTIDYKELLNKDAFHLFINKNSTAIIPEIVFWLFFLLCYAVLQRLFLNDVQVKVIETAKTIADEVAIDAAYETQEIKEQQVYDDRDLKLVQQQQALIYKLQQYVNEIGKPNEEEIKVLREDNKTLSEDNKQLKQQLRDLTQAFETLENDVKHTTDQYASRNEALEQELKALRETLHSVPQNEVYTCVAFFFFSPNRMMSMAFNDNGPLITSPIEKQLQELEEEKRQMETLLGERLRLVQDLQEQVGELEKVVAQRTQDLAQRDRGLDAMESELTKTKNLLFRRMQSSVRLKNEVLELEEELQKQDQFTPKEVFTIDLCLFQCLLFSPSPI
ncbi:flagellar associated protein [Reticulomyxa filosa]|uniref:Flagellar associated protein n=1 Tax=Reticulomyxa filosa TaxID=46433 RepID=X6MKU7_RETFI|nr:flagellar associated protein [Reticulomyxa filosa]|eukprot:ETO14077.1 flagellar associated protein [Reticulomyxa filosa]